MVLFLAVASASACSLTSIPDLTSGNGRAAGDAGATPDAFCASLSPAPAFCEDFDGDPDLLRRWDRVHAFDGTFGVALTSSSARSAPNALLARVEPGGPDCAYATLEKKVPGAYRAAKLSFAVRIEQASDLPDKSVLAIQTFGDGNAQCQVYVAASGSAFGVGEQVLHEDGRRENTEHAITPLLPLGRWARVGVDVDETARKLTVDVDGAVVLSVPTDLACPYVPAVVTAQVGLFCEPTRTSPRRVLHDDVTLAPR